MNRNMGEVNGWVSVRYPEYAKRELAVAYSELAAERDHPLEVMDNPEKKWAKIYGTDYRSHNRAFRSWKYRTKCSKGFQRRWRWGFSVRPVKLTRIMADVQAWMTATDYMMVA